MYFKIFRKTMLDDGFLFQEGLNDCQRPLYKDPRFQEGFFNGLGFLDDEQLLQQLDLRADVICSVSVPTGEKVKKYKDECRSQKIILSEEKPLWSVETFEWLQSLGIHVCDHTCSDVLSGAVARGKLELVKWLISNGFDVTHDHNRALCWAVEYGDLDMIQCLIEHGADINDVDDMELELAEEKGHCPSFLMDFMRNCRKKGESYVF